MKKGYLLIFLCITLGSCIPLRIAPTIEDYRVVEGKKFKKSLPQKTMFVFEDPKDEGHFYNYINTKFKLDDYRVDVDVPFQIENKEYYFAYYEVEIPTKTLNLLPIVIDGILESTETNDAVFSDAYSSRKGYWYIAIEVYDQEENDCLNDNSLIRKPMMEYLRELKQEYLSTHNYNEVVFKN
ncbi:hypothetical protein [Croceivirga thetidis]|uniref:DUF4136 domain-containing protein n=1 Tax=Croceivirga thetidis TaxID=2721623 RepID=A0ABX1GMR9_9FLAO|nr:hypothetical protein [Croceivirga thetidis]NKI31220.1 hypothetical protein [Croceivirga thetidis]